MRISAVSATQSREHGLHVLSLLCACLPSRQCWDLEPIAGNGAGVAIDPIRYWIFRKTDGHRGPCDCVLLWRASECIWDGESCVRSRRLAGKAAACEP